MKLMGRPRTKHKDMPPGMREVSGRWYWRPTDEASRAACELIAPGKASLPAGGSKDEARRWWAKVVLPKLQAQEAAAASSAGTVAEVIADYLASPQYLWLAEKTRSEYARALDVLKAKWGSVRYARSEDEASRGEYLRRMHIASHLDGATAKVAANRQIAALSSAFAVAIRKGRTEYNPCRGVGRNTEAPRRRLVTHSEYARLKHAAPEVIRVAMLLARLTGMREGDLLALTWRQVVGDEIRVTPAKTASSTGISQRIRVTPSLRVVLEAAKHLRGGLRSMFVIHNSSGQGYTQSGFQSMWQRTVKKSGVVDVHFHDLRALAVTAAERRERGSGSDLAGHVDPKTTRRIYRRGAVKVSPVR